MKLSQTRQALVEEFLKSFPAEGGSNAFWRRTSEQQLVAQFILQALNDYTESIVRMVERMGKPGMEGGDRLLLEQQMGYQQALNDIKEELNK